MSRVPKVLVAACFLVCFLMIAPLQQANPRKGSGVSVKRQIEPRYPAWAYNHGVSSGYAKIAFYVDEQGQVSELMPIEYSYEVFAQELMTSVMKWKFRPARKNGRPVKSVCHAYWEFLPDRPIETNALFDASKRMENKPGEAYRELKYREDEELDSRVGLVAFPGLLVQVGDPEVEAGLQSVRARVSFFVSNSGEVALPQVVESSHPELNRDLEAALKGATFAVPSYKGQAVLALMERTYDFPVVWSEEQIPKTIQ